MAKKKGGGKGKKGGKGGKKGGGGGDEEQMLDGHAAAAKASSGSGGLCGCCKGLFGGGKKPDDDEGSNFKFAPMANESMAFNVSWDDEEEVRNSGAILAQFWRNSLTAHPSSTTGTGTRRSRRWVSGASAASPKRCAPS